MKLFLHLNLHVEDKKSAGKLLPKSAQIFYACLNFRLSPRLIIVSIVLKSINNIPYVVTLKAFFGPPMITVLK